MKKHANEMYLDNYAPDTKDLIPSEIAKNYAVSKDQALAFVIDKDAENLYEYISSNLRVIVYAAMKA